MENRKGNDAVKVINSGVISSNIKNTDAVSVVSKRDIQRSNPSESNVPEISKRFFFFSSRTLQTFLFTYFSTETF